MKSRSGIRDHQWRFVTNHAHVLEYVATDPSCRLRDIASTVGIKWRGTPAWLLARTYHLALMPGLGRKVRLLVDWNVNLLFGRDLAELCDLGTAPPLDGGAESDLEAHSSGGTTAVH